MFFRVFQPLLRFFRILKDAILINFSESLRYICETFVRMWDTFGWTSFRAHIFQGRIGMSSLPWTDVPTNKVRVCAVHHTLTCPFYVTFLQQYLLEYYKLLHHQLIINLRILSNDLSEYSSVAKVMPFVVGVDQRLHFT